MANVIPSPPPRQLFIAGGRDALRIATPTVSLMIPRGEVTLFLLLAESARRQHARRLTANTKQVAA